MSNSQHTDGRNNVQDFIAPIAIDYRALFYRYKKNWYWFALALALFLTAAYLITKYSVPEYATSGTFIVEDPASGDGVSAREFTRELGFEDETLLEDELNVLTSRTMVAEVVRELDLNLTVTHQGEIRNTLLYKPDEFTIVPIDTTEIPEEEIKYGSVEMVALPGGKQYLVTDTDSTRYAPGAPFTIGNRTFTFLVYGDFVDNIKEETRWIISHTSPIKVAGSILRQLNASQAGKSNTVNVSYKDINPYRAADVINTLFRLYTSQILDERSLNGEQAVAFIDGRLEQVTRDLYSVEASLAGLRQAEGLIVANDVRGSDYLTRLNTADEQLSDLEVRRSLIEDLRLQLMSGTSDDFPPLTVASEVLDGTLAQLVTEYNSLIFEREQKLEAATAISPNVVTFTEQLLQLKQSLARSLSTLSRETEERIRRVEERIRPIETQMAQIPDDERRLLQVERQRQVVQDLFVFLRQRREEAAITVAAQTPNTRIVDPALPNTNPVYPKPLYNYVGAFALAFLLPGLFFFLLEMFNTKVQMEKDAVRRTNVPIVGRIGRTSKKNQIVVRRSSRSGVAEMFRILRTNLSFQFKPDQTPVILLTSGVSGEGKTFVSSNLGYSLALGNRKTVLIGADMRKPRLYEAIMGGKPGSDRSLETPGLSNFLNGEARYEDIIRPTDEQQLFLIESGPIPPDPSELLLRKETGELFERLRRDFDVVIVDAPPVGLVTDALQLKDYVDISLYVIRLGTTPKESLSVLNETSEEGKLPNMGIVLNGLQPKRDYGYGYAQGYYKKS